MIHLQLIVPGGLTAAVLAELDTDLTVTNVVVLAGAAVRPAGDVVLADVAREEASAVIRGLERLGLTEEGAISVSETLSERSRGGREAARLARGLESDAVVWEEVEERTYASAELSGVFLALLVLAAMIGSLAVLLQSEILMVGAMVVGPEFGPLAGIVIGVVAGSRGLAARSLRSLCVGVPVAVVGAAILVGVLRLAGLAPGSYAPASNVLAALVQMPDWSVILVAMLAGVAGLLALTTAHAGALAGVFISVATVPALAGMGVAVAYGDAGAWLASAVQLSANVAGIVAAGVLTLAAQRWLFARRVRARRAAV